MFPDEIKQHFAFAKEKLTELVDLATILAGNREALKDNQALFAKTRFTENQAVQKKIRELTEQDYTRKPAFQEREAIQNRRLIFQYYRQPPLGLFHKQGRSS